jgi:phosphoglucosamine mutase
MLSNYQTEVPKRLFGTSGVRGIVYKDLTKDILRDLGQAIATNLPRRSWIIIANDTRKSRAEVKAAVVMGLIASGARVLDVGTLPTPALACITRNIGVDAGIMVTASHNPPEYNGIKLFSADGIGYSREQEKSVEQIYFRRNFRTEVGSIQQAFELQRYYFDYLKQIFGANIFDKKFRIVVDPGNGAASQFASDLFSNLGLEVLPLNDTPDGSFPGRNPEPREDTLVGTYEFLKETRADLAVCFDGDADRVVFVDEQGFIGFDEAITFIASLAVKSSGKKRVATTVETGKLLEFGLQGMGVNVVRGMVGDVSVACLARSIDAAIGVEPVGVYIMPEAGFYPNSFLAALTLLRSVGSISEVRRFFDSVPKLYPKQRKIPCSNAEKFDLMQKVIARSTLFGIGIPNTVDGLRLESEDSWLLIRPSGTEPIIRISAESTSEALTQVLLEKATSVITGLMER